MRDAYPRNEKMRGLNPGLEFGRSLRACGTRASRDQSRWGARRRLFKSFGQAQKTSRLLCPPYPPKFAFLQTERVCRRSCQDGRSTFCADVLRASCVLRASRVSGAASVRCAGVLNVFPRVTRLCRSRPLVLQRIERFSSLHRLADDQ